MKLTSVFYGISVILLILSTINCRQDGIDHAAIDNGGSRDDINHAAADNGGSREFDTQAWREIYNYPFNAIVEGAKFEVINREYINFSEIDTGKCGIIRIDRDVFRFSCAYVDNRLFACLEERQGNNVWSMIIDRDEIDRWREEYIEETLSRYEIYQNLPDDEKRTLAAIGYLIRRFISSKLVECDITECMTAAMVQQQIDGMKEEWGIYVSAGNVGDIVLHFDRDTGSNYIEFQLDADGQEFYRWEFFIRSNGLQESEIPSLSGELVIEH